MVVTVLVPTTSLAKKKARKPQTQGWRTARTCYGRYQEPPQSPACFKILQLISSSSTKAISQGRPEDCTASTAVFQRGRGGGRCFPWLQLPLLVESRSQGAPAASPAPSAPLLPRFKQQGNKRKPILTIFWGNW